eukprot:s3816_g3.t1
MALQDGFHRCGEGLDKGICHGFVFDRSFRAGLGRSCMPRAIETHAQGLGQGMDVAVPCDLMDVGLILFGILFFFLVFGEDGFFWCSHIQAKMNLNMDYATKSYRNLSLSYRGSERQAPNCLQLALRFSRIMEAHAAAGRHPPGTSTEDRVRAVIAEFHESPELTAKHRLDEEKTKSEARHVLQRHTDHVKWAYCAFSTEQLRGNRWMVGATPKASGCPPALRKALTMTDQSQVMHFKLVIHAYTEAGRRLRTSSKPRMRWSPQVFDTHCDLAAMYSSVLDEARELSSWNSDKEAALMKAFFQKHLVFELGEQDYMSEVEAAVTAKLSTWKLQHLGLWCDLVEPPATPVKVHTASELMELEEEAQAARFREVRAKLAQDTSSMCQFNSAKEEATRRSHVVKVMHEKSQLEAGKQFCSSALWTRQVLQDFPSAIAEKDFVVPGDVMLSHCERRNLTDLQETAQWLGGVKNNFATVLIHPTSYDGCVELAGLQHGMWVTGSSTGEASFKSSKDVAWKAGQSPMDKQQQRYKKDVPADDMPKSPTTPDLKLCQFSNGRLVIPTDIRKHFLQCPIYGPEWREIIVKFDKDWGVAVQPDPAPSPQPQGSGNQNGSSPPPSDAQVKEEVKLEPGFDWKSAFPGSPQTVEKLREKFGADITEMAGASSTSSFFLCPGPQLYIVAKEPLHIKAADAQICWKLAYW